MRHVLKSVAPDSKEYVPSGQKSQDKAPEFGWKVPGTQGKQSKIDVAPSIEFDVPVGHSLQVDEVVAPTDSEYVPFRQKFGIVIASELQNAPSGHSLHVREPKLLEKEPLGQF
ncbi:MAG: hypothetical protein LAT81_15470 [Oceanicaulis sp.]|nr:hypothetical protein [Oceanicaulis sp.]